MAMAVLSFLLSTLMVLTVTAPGDRILTINNKCNEVVRVGRTGGRCAMANPSCPPGQTLNPNDMFCYWDLPSPDGGPWQTQDLQSNQSITLTLSNPDQSCLDSSTGGVATIKWSGNIWGATGCNTSKGGVCETAICFDGSDQTQNGKCPAFSGPVGPVTRAEFTLQSQATDFYDITLIDGVNLPVEMKPSTRDLITASAVGLSGTAAEYWCGNPGGITAMSSSLGGCSWSYDLTSIPRFGDQSTSLTLVAKSTDPNDPNANCTKDSDCPPRQVCGTQQQLNSVSGGPEPGLFRGRCGRFIGLWNANGLCTWAQGIPNTSNLFPNRPPFNCKTSVGLGRFNELYGCSGAYDVSGYNSNCNQNADMVCGCPAWESAGINAPATTPCQCNNPEWQENAFPWIQWMKKACPTAYAYPFDDASSTFQCKNQNQSNTVGYTITFCPGGKSLTRNVANSAVGIGTSTAVVLILTGIVATLM